MRTLKKAAQVLVERYTERRVRSAIVEAAFESEVIHERGLDNGLVEQAIRMLSIEIIDDHCELASLRSERELLFLLDEIFEQEKLVEKASLLSILDDAWQVLYGYDPAQDYQAEMQRSQQAYEALLASMSEGDSSAWWEVLETEFEFYLNGKSSPAMSGPDDDIASVCHLGPDELLLLDESACVHLATVAKEPPVSVTGLEDTHFFDLGEVEEMNRVRAMHELGCHQSF